MLARHYAPRTRLVYLRTRTGATGLAAAITGALAEGLCAGVLALDEDAAVLAGCGPGLRVARLGSVADAGEVGRRLFAAMRELDGAELDVIFVRSMGEGGLWAAIDDRLRRAAASVVD
jgi:L-threonylcarbamoyladenylate synthase